MVDRSASVSIEAAAELMRVDALTIRKWVMDGLLQIERRGPAEFVSLREVHALVSWATSRKKSAQRGTLRGLLREAPKQETLDLTELQKLARDRIQ